MSNSKKSPVHVALTELGWPILYGFSATVAFYFLAFRGPFNFPLVHRYFASHPVSIVTTTMFFVGGAALLLKLIDVLRNASAIKSPLLPDAPTGGQRVGDTPRLLEHLSQLASPISESYLGRRLRDGLQFVSRRGMADELDDELKYLADQELARQHQSFSFVRIIIWATPMLGFLGTVIGIAQALGNLDASELASSADTAMDKLLAGLYVAFDTTALALSLSIVLMFIQFFIDRLETQILDAVDRMATDQLSGRFQQFAGRIDPYVVPIERMSQAVIQSSEKLVSQQVSLWQSTVGDMQQQWHEMMAATGDTLCDTFTGSLEGTLNSHSQRLAGLEESAVNQAETRWKQWNEAMSDNALVLDKQREEMVRQGDLMNRAVDAVGDVLSLEKALNDNLNVLADTRQFEEAVTGLSAAIQLLGSQVGRNQRQRPVSLQDGVAAPSEDQSVDAQHDDQLPENDNHSERAA
ncbi:MAG: MotA/TolQ/ExbB proton channel family protein [Pirellulaceae bacterium]|nr:MotA/TolQ/ExbB proton channel family protein [Planctomycetaceae bacterium]HIM30974.1 MotA/TolQ/ExbB proton channel family protein [Planctomycetota bacterium]